MFPLLYKYFALNGQLSIPGIGRFYTAKVPAQLDFLNSQMAAPELTINFDQESAIADKQLYAFLARENKSGEVEVIRLVQDFSSEINDNLNKHKSVSLPGIGVLEKNNAGDFHFTPDENVQKYYPVVKAERVIRPDASHEILVGDNTRTNIQMQEMYEPEQEEATTKDYWWVFAIALAIIAIATITFYYLQHGNFR